MQPDHRQSAGEQPLERNTAFESSDSRAASSAGMQLCGMVIGYFTSQASEPMSNSSLFKIFARIFGPRLERSAENFSDWNKHNELSARPLNQ
jgi:hypothetical protein